MSTIHFLNVLEGDCNIIQHDSNRITVIDVSNGYDENDTPEETAVKNSVERHLMRERTNVPSNKKDYKQKKDPDNPIDYLKNACKINDIFRFVVTHPDMDHIDGIKDLFDNFQINCFWDTNNKKELSNFIGGGYNKSDWKFYTELRDEKTKYARRAFLQGNHWQYFDQDDITILAPTQKLIDEGIRTGNYNDSSFVLLYMPPKKNGKKWKILFGGDSENKTWDAILGNSEYREKVKDIDILFAPHHGRDSGRSYGFLDVLKPRLTLFGNASSEHLAYSCYPKIRLTNNQCGYIIIDITEDALYIYVKNFEFANDFRRKRDWGEPKYRHDRKAYHLFTFNA